MVERILEVLRFKNLTQSQFADEIGVQRSNISHLLSGRNKPSLDFIQKIIKRFPEINPEYLIAGTGNLIKRGTQTAIAFEDIPVPPVEILITNAEEGNSRSGMEKPAKKRVEKVIERAKPVNNSTDKEKNPERKPDQEIGIEKIVYFYKDKTFREYIPAKD